MQGASLAAVSGIACIHISQSVHMHMGGHVWRACGPVRDFCGGENRLIREVTRRGAKNCVGGLSPRVRGLIAKMRFFAGGGAGPAAVPAGALA